MNGNLFLALNLFLFVVMVIIINSKVTKRAKKNGTWSPYGAADIISGFSIAITIFIWVVWLVVFCSLGLEKYIY